MYKILRDCKCTVDGISVLHYKKNDVIELDPKVVKILGSSIKKAPEPRAKK